MRRVPGPEAKHAMSARSVVAQAGAFRTAAERSIEEGLLLPAISSLHEASRLAITAVAALKGWRFANAPGAHEAVIDYALGIRLVDRRQFAQLDALRDLRHQVNYPADIIAPTEAEARQFAGLVDDVIALAIGEMPRRRIPPQPPAGR